jgi:hypothetical protein
MRTAIVSLLLSFATTVGCGSGAPAPGASEESPAPAASAGAETTPEPPSTDEAAEAPPESEPLVSATGPGTLVLTASIAGKPVPAVVRVLDPSGEKRAEAKAGEPLTLPAGSYELEVAITDAAVMADKPTQKRELVLQAGQTANVEARFQWAKVTLDVRINGRSQPGAKVQLLRAEEVVAEMKSGAPPTPVTPGRYEADVLLKGAKIRVKGLQFPDSATQIVPVNVRM